MVYRVVAQRQDLQIVAMQPLNFSSYFFFHTCFSDHFQPQPIKCYSRPSVKILFSFYWSCTFWDFSKTCRRSQGEFTSPKEPKYGLSLRLGSLHNVIYPGEFHICLLFQPTVSKWGSNPRTESLDLFLSQTFTIFLQSMREPPFRTPEEKNPLYPETFAANRGCMKKSSYASSSAVAAPLVTIEIFSTAIFRRNSFL